jgi:F-type H+-transporting ATPase subunit delta
MTGRTIGRRYAKALLAAADARAAAPETLLAEIEAVAAVFAAEPRAAALLENPKLLPADRTRILDRVLDATAPGPLVRHFLHTVLAKGRLGALAEIVAEFRTLADAKAGVVRAAVVSTVPLPEADADALRGLLGRRFGKQVVLSASVDPALIGGLVVRIGSLSFDGSVRAQLAAIHRKLLHEVTVA